ncbi:MAG: hypothetical protein ACM65M_10280 [Microcoleus sp.]
MANPADVTVKLVNSYFSLPETHWQILLQALGRSKVRSPLLY